MLLLIVSHNVFQLFVFKIFQAKYRDEIIGIIDEGISEDELTLFTFSKDDLKNGTAKIQWMEENEFRFNDEMYDVVAKEINDDSVYYYCIYDENESRLYTVFDEYFQKMLEDDPDKLRDLNILNNSLSEFYSKPFVHENKPSFYEKGKYYTDVNNILLEGEHFLVIPPPRS